MKCVDLYSAVHQYMIDLIALYNRPHLNVPSERRGITMQVTNKIHIRITNVPTLGIDPRTCGMVGARASQQTIAPLIMKHCILNICKMSFLIVKCRVTFIFTCFLPYLQLCFFLNKLLKIKYKCFISLSLILLNRFKALASLLLTTV